MGRAKCGSGSKIVSLDKSPDERALVSFTKYFKFNFFFLFSSHLHLPVNTYDSFKYDIYIYIYI